MRLLRLPAKPDQTISGIAINLIGPGVALFVCRLLFDGATMSQPVPNKIAKLFGGLKVQGALQNLNVDVTVVIAFLLAVFIWFFLYKTKWGFTSGLWGSIRRPRIPWAFTCT